MTATEKGNTIAGRGREALARLVIRFWREETGTIVANKAATDYDKLLTLFASWLRQRSAQVDGAQPEAITHMVVGRFLPPAAEWIEIVKLATEAMVFEFGMVPSNNNPHVDVTYDDDARTSSARSNEGVLSKGEARR